MRATHTYAALPVPKALFDLVAEKLREAGYHHAFDNDENAIDMAGIGLVVDEQAAPSPPPPSPPPRSLWRITNSDGTRWRTMDSIGMPDWTDNPEKALTTTLREHVDAYAADDPEDVRIVEVPMAKRYTLDTADLVCFYEQEFYVLSNFSAFNLVWRNIRFSTSESAYHWEKFPHDEKVRAAILNAKSAHDAFKCAEHFRAARRPDWDAVKVDIMRDILRTKAQQHEYVRRKLLETGDRLLVENSWRDPFWGWGPNRDGQNMLGKLWMEVRAELRRTTP